MPADSIIGVYQRPLAVKKSFNCVTPDAKDAKKKK